jgi:hypothetical protein
LKIYWKTITSRHWIYSTCFAIHHVSGNPDLQVEAWFDPANGGENMEEREVNALIRSELQAHDTFVVLDVAHMSEFRADAHPDRWLGKKDAHLLWGHDCLHWCLPGLPDIWVDMLSAIILQHIQGSQL